MDDYFFDDDAEQEEVQPKSRMSQKAQEAYRNTAASFNQAYPGLTPEQVVQQQQQQIKAAATEAAQQALAQNYQQQVLDKAKSDLLNKGYKPQHLRYIQAEAEAVIFEKKETGVSMSLDEVIKEAAKRFDESTQALPTKSNVRVSAMDLGTSGGAAKVETEKPSYATMSDADFEKERARVHNSYYQ